MLARVTNSLVPRRSTSLFDSPIDRLFDDVLTDWKYFDRAPTSPRFSGYTNRIDDDGVLHCEIDMPGVSADNLDITVEDNMIFIKGTRGERKLSYRMSPGGDYDIDSADAVIKDGLLTISIKPYIKPEPKRIPIKTG